MLNLNEPIKFDLSGLKFPGLVESIKTPVTGGTSPVVNTTRQDRLANRVTGVIDKVTGVPGKIIDFGNDLNEEMIDFANRFRRGEDVARENLTKNKVKGIAGQAGSFLQKNWGSVVSVIIAIVAFNLLRK